jgi:hypothetical protein
LCSIDTPVADADCRFGQPGAPATQRPRAEPDTGILKPWVQPPSRRRFFITFGIVEIQAGTAPVVRFHDYRTRRPFAPPSNLKVVSRTRRFVARVGYARCISARCLLIVIQLCKHALENH